MNKPTESHKMQELESLRGLAAFLVIIVHIPYPLFNFHSGIAKNGYLMVELFFVLSGFVIFGAYDGKINSARDVMRFQFLRFARLYPVHLLFLGCFLAFEILKYLATVHYGIKSPNAEAFTHNNLTAFLQQLFLTHAIGPTGNITSFNGPSWSISVEFYTYFLFALILLWANKAKLWIFGAIVGISLALIIMNKTFDFSYLLHCFVGFFIGCLTAKLSRSFSAVIPTWFSMATFMIIIAFLILKTDSKYDPTIYFLTAILILTLVKTEGGLLKRILNFKILTWLGMISYSLYMSHSAILWVINSGVRLILKPIEIIGLDGKSMPQLSTLETVAIYAATFILTIAVSALTYKYIEAPFREKSRNLSWTVKREGLAQKQA